MLISGPETRKLPTQKWPTEASIYVMRSVQDFDIITWPDLICEMYVSHLTDRNWHTKRFKQHNVVAE